MTYQISNTTSGADLGTYTGATPLDAYRAMMADAGYRTASDAESAGLSLDEIPADVSVVEMTGIAAIEYAERAGLTLRKYADPTEDARDGLTPAEAREIADEDPSLIHL